jgi:glycosyltransferase involved in cell wall biosynthesis
MNQLKVTFLWAELTGYFDLILNELLLHTENLDVIYFDFQRPINNGFEKKTNPKINFLPRSKTSDIQILELLEKGKPEIIVVSGWYDKGYISVVKEYKKNNKTVKIVNGIDDQWRSTFRQNLGTIYYKIFLKNLFTHMWISGKPQFAFAQRFGYQINNIINDIYCGCFPYINEAASFNTRFLYVGRLMHHKGLDLLVKAHKKLESDQRKKWPLHIIGDGELVNWVKDNLDEYIIHIPFLQPHILHEELMKGGVGCVPSRHEQWGVIIHEYVQLGVPLITSDICGAATEFLINNSNGYIFKSGSCVDLKNKMIKMIDNYDFKYPEFSKTSLLLSKRINPTTSVKSLLSILH